MGTQYKITYDRKFYKDLSSLELKTNTEQYKKIKNEMDIIFKALQHMPRIHKTLCFSKDPDGEYRRIVLKKYIIIYKIVRSEIIILRIFNQKENYLNSKNFILKEKSQNYLITK